MSHWETAGASDEWYTPKYVFDALGCRFDLDVAHPNVGIVVYRDKWALDVPCDDWIFEDSLNTPWTGFVWMNPPFGGRNSLTPWLDKFIAHGNGIALVPDRTSAPWFQAAWPHMDLALFVAPKIKFLRPDGSTGKQPGTGTALLAIGEQGANALRRAQGAGLGVLAIPA